MLIVGFILYQFGISSELHQTTLLAKWLNQLAGPLTSWGLSQEALAIILQFTGGLITIFGLIICFAAAARPNQPQFKARPTEPSSVQPTKPIVKCRFCDAEIEYGSSFCPNCNKSQT